MFMLSLPSEQTPRLFHYSSKSCQGRLDKGQTQTYHHTKVIITLLLFYFWNTTILLFLAYHALPSKSLPSFAVLQLFTLHI